MAAISAVLDELSRLGVSDRKISEATQVERNRVGFYRRGVAKTFDWFEILAIYRFAGEKGVDIGAIDNVLSSVVKFAETPSPKQDAIRSDEYMELDARLRALEDFMGPNMLRERAKRLMETTNRAFDTPPADEQREKAG